ncbi:Carbohydrate esterase family 4 protein [Mycena sanguinolenta]|uniref:chitin deacetylase n=1 Tax=Mycena sanguinolenta TaxID=230812 RepID=A0A8H6XNN6_9AGAR|nr:Carbohydrate esterase family 4 protein [Mycena sanguinolenta]
MLIPTLLALPLLSTAVVHGRHDAHTHIESKRLPTANWFHESDHPVHGLFRRASEDTDGVTYATVGSSEWAAQYPDPWPSNGIDTSKLPAAWVSALNAAVASKTIPDVPIPTIGSDGNPAYPSGQDPTSSDICSGTYQCRVPGDIWDGPDGTVGISFDDGPAGPLCKSISCFISYSILNSRKGTADILTFLAKNNQPVTHFLIGSQIISLADQFTQMYNMSHDIAVHTWSHPYMTTQTNLQVVGELGWTMQLIHNSTGGRIPKYWRPPYGDTDKRVSAIAKEVFGLTTIVWNQDTEDWSLTDTPPGTSAATIQSQMKQWLGGSKSPGLIILEHELSTQSAAAFIAAYPLMVSNGWKVESLVSLVGNNVSYQNAANNFSPVTENDIINAKNDEAQVSAGGSSTTGGSSTASSKSTATGGAGQSEGAKSPGSPTGTSSAPSTSTTGKSSASSRWTTGPTAVLSAAVLFMLWQQ